MICAARIKRDEALRESAGVMCAARRKSEKRGRGSAGKRMEECAARQRGGSRMLDVIKTRRSTRKYQDRMIPEEKLEQILEAGRYAPSGGNRQTTHFLVVKNPEVLDRLRELVEQEFAKMELTEDLYPSLAHAISASKKGGYVFHFHAPVLIITANRRDYMNNQADCSCALENMMLMANALDLGSCWINQLKWLNENEVILAYLRQLGLEEDERVYGSVAVGFADTPDGMPARNPLPRTGNPVTVIE